ncbi:MAG: glycosidase [Patescibacteria group bacterium]
MWHLRRYASNPILAPTNRQWENRAVFNCAATEFEGRVLLLYRAQGSEGISRFGLAFSDDGYHISERLPEPVFEPDSDTEYEQLGVEDPRITKIGQTYYITYTAASRYPPVGDWDDRQHPKGSPWRVRVSVAHTHDFRTFTRHGVIISHIDSKDAALFPEKLDGQFVMIHRVVPDIRLAIADGLTHFKERGPILWPSPSGWDSDRIGVGAPPIKTPHGWVLIYHGVGQNRTYSLGLALLDLDDPTVTLARTTTPILKPEEPYEKRGVVPNVVFSCGAIQRDDQLLVYYGAADKVVGLATMPYQKLLDWAKAGRRQSSGR